MFGSAAAGRRVHAAGWKRADRHGRSYGEAHRLASRVWPLYSDPFSRHDFTLPQLFACLVVREMLKLSYRKAEALLADTPDWLAAIGLARAPDHNALWRAFGHLLETRRVKRMLDLLAELFAQERLLGLSRKPLTIDSTCYERAAAPLAALRPRPPQDEAGRGAEVRGRPRETPPKADQGAGEPRARSLKARTMPKLSPAVAAACHLILAARAHTAGPAPTRRTSRPLLYHSWRRPAAASGPPWPTPGSTRRRIAGSPGWTWACGR